MKKSSDSLPRAFRYLHLKSCSSTQDLIKNSESKWFLLRADHQEAGRGQKDRTWESPVGGLYYSLEFPHPSVENGNTPLYLLWAAYVWLSLLREQFPTYADDFQLKWPNDLLYKNYKLGGFIGEKSGKKIFIGVGINVNNRFGESPDSEFRLPPVSLRSITQTEQNPGTLLMNWFRRFYSSLQPVGSGIEPDLSVIEGSMRTVGCSVRSEGEEGEVVGLAPNGGLKVRFEDNERVVHRTEDVEVIDR